MEETAQVHISCSCFSSAIRSFSTACFSKQNNPAQKSIVFTLIIIDIDECVSAETNECDPNALCTNTDGSYICRCLSGYQGDGRNCTGKYSLVAVSFVDFFLTLQLHDEL